MKYATPGVAGDGGGVQPEKLVVVVVVVFFFGGGRLRPTSQSPYPIYDPTKNLISYKLLVLGHRSLIKHTGKACKGYFLKLRGSYTLKIVILVSR